MTTRTNEQNKIYQRELYARNPDWRAKKIQQAKDRYHRMKAERAIFPVVNSNEQQSTS
jgi:hypothetical protein